MTVFRGGNNQKCDNMTAQNANKFKKKWTKGYKKPEFHNDISILCYWQIKK